MKFEIEAQSGRARAGKIKSSYGEFNTPMVTLNFTTALANRGYKPLDIVLPDTEIPLLRNTFLMNVDGISSCRDDIGWADSVMADSGGFQMVSMAKNLKILPDGLEFDLNGQHYKWTPRQVVETAKALGVDYIMPLDFVVDVKKATTIRAWQSVAMTARWHKLSRGVANESLYYIVQGGLNLPARRYSLWDANCQLQNGGASAVAIGGLAGGETRAQLYRTVDFCTKRLPDDKARHMLGICKPRDIIELIALGIDTFDGIAATREGRHGRVWDRLGDYYSIRQVSSDDQRPLSEDCDCDVCQGKLSRGQIRDLYRAEGEAKGKGVTDEALAEAQAKTKEAKRLLMRHNFYQNLRAVREARQAILGDRFAEWKKEYLNQ